MHFICNTLAIFWKHMASSEEIYRLLNIIIDRKYWFQRADISGIFFERYTIGSVCLQSNILSDRKKLDNYLLEFRNNQRNAPVV